MQLTVATADTGRLTRAAMFGLDCIWRDGFSYKKAGVIFPTLVKAGAVQGSLFLRPDGSHSETPMAFLDALNRRYGRGDGRLWDGNEGKRLDGAGRTSVGPLHDAGSDLLPV